MGGAHHQARKRFGQHFLADDGIIEGIVRASTRIRARRWSRSVPAWAR
jgi:16S rRNA A1518/A1519 N6-dimethyltransferase RsmA/KsgA/DIM1 with predicted DNA glycosylase/AP lyase activity